MVPTSGGVKNSPAHWPLCSANLRMTDQSDCSGHSARAGGCSPCISVRPWLRGWSRRRPRSRIRGIWFSRERAWWDRERNGTGEPLAVRGHCWPWHGVVIGRQDVGDPGHGRGSIRTCLPARQSLNRVTNRFRGIICPARGLAWRARAGGRGQECPRSVWFSSGCFRGG